MEIKNAFNEPADGTFGSLKLHLALFIVIVWLNMRSVKKGEVQYEVMLPSVFKLIPEFLNMIYPTRTGMLSFGTDTFNPARPNQITSTESHVENGF